MVFQVTETDWQYFSILFISFVLYFRWWLVREIWTCCGCVDTSEHVLAVHSVLLAMAHIWPLPWLLDCCFLVVESKLVKTGQAVYKWCFWSELINCTYTAHHLSLYLADCSNHTDNISKHFSCHKQLIIFLCNMWLDCVVCDRYTLSTRPESIAAMLCAFFPKFPTHSNDNRWIAVIVSDYKTYTLDFLDFWMLLLLVLSGVTILCFLQLNVIWCRCSSWESKGHLWKRCGCVTVCKTDC